MQNLLLNENISFLVLRSIISVFPESIHISREAEHVKQDFEIFEFAKRNGLDTSKEKFILIRPDNIEEGMETVETLAKTNQLPYIIWDSTSSAKAKAEAEKEFGDALMGLNARSYSSGLRCITGVLSKTNTTVVFISQMRDSLNAYSGPAIGV